MLSRVEQLYLIWKLDAQDVCVCKYIYNWPPDVKNWLIWKDPDAEKD